MKLWQCVFSLLENAAVYRIFGQLVLGDAYRVYLREYVKPLAGEKLLDIGCGPGDILNDLPAVDYVGFDISAEYIDAARMRFGDAGRFFCSDVELAAVEGENGTFDVVLATGVVHHLDDERALCLFQLARDALKPGGRLVTYDGCIADHQPKLARWMVRHDRGRYVRPVASYVTLAKSVFSEVRQSVRNDLLRIPYTHLILQCVK